jgi:peroxiredoxin
MMKNILILGPNDPMPVGEVRRKGQLHATRSPVAAQLLNGKAPEWRVPLVDAGGKRHTLAEFSNKKRVLVFFLGAGCQPCLEQLRAFRDLRDQFERQGITLIAVGSCTSRDLASVKKSVEDKGAVPFVFLADPESKVFEQYQLVDRRDSGLLHGVFCLNSSGDLIWQSGASAAPYRNVLDTVKAFAAPLTSTQANLR